MDEERDDNSRQHETTLLSSFNFSGHDQPAQISTDQDFFNMLPNVECLSPLPPPYPPPPPPSSMMLPNIEPDCALVKGESSGTKRTSDVAQVSHPQNEVSTQEVVERKDEQQPPRTRRRRSAQVHNLSERERRGRINEKIRTLKDLIPNCNKADKASVLTDAIEYIKFLQQQVQAKSTYQNMLVPYYSSYFPTRPMMGMGYEMSMCYNSAYSTGFPMLPFPQGLNPLGESGIFLPSPSQLQYPSVESIPNTTSQPNMETVPTGATYAAPTTSTPSTSVTSLSSSYSRGESSSSQSLHSIEADFHQTKI